MAQKLYIIRGLPGSGKSTLAEKIIYASKYNSKKIEHFEADMYFINENGEYKWNANDISAAHEWCFRGVEDALWNGYDVIVSNTFVELRTMEQYFVLGEQLECEIIVIECTSDYGSIHNVPAATIEKMKRKWIPNSNIQTSEQKHELRRENKTTYTFMNDSDMRLKLILEYFDNGTKHER